jgi:hypothetical protein
LESFRKEPTAQARCDVLGMAVTGNATYRRRLQMTLRERLLFEDPMAAWDREMAISLEQHRLAEVPGWVLDSAAPVDAPDSQSGRPCGGEGRGHHF